MKITMVAFGNGREAYIEKQFKDGINLIFSCPENNKGKTVVLQSIFYALGSEAKFPRNFDNDKNNYYVIEIRGGEKKFLICRRKNFFVVKNEHQINFFDSQSDFKRYYNNNIEKLPTLFVNGREKISDLYLYNHAFFVGQDGRDSSSIINAGQYNKKDFENLILAMAGISSTENTDVDAARLKNDLEKVEGKRKILIAQNKILKNKNYPIHLSSYTANKARIDQKMKNLGVVETEIKDLTNERNKFLKRISKNDLLIKELEELNRSISQGELKCADCGSKNIIYSNQSVDFDVSNHDIRRQILASLRGRIDSCNEEIERIDSLILRRQQELNEILKDDDVSIENLLIHKTDILGSLKTDEQIKEIDLEIERIKGEISEVGIKKHKKKESKEEFLKRLTNKLNDIFSKINVDGNNDRIELFTKRNEVISGSEGAAFFIARICALWEILQHNHPIIIDCFRDGELSSEKEDIVIELFKRTGNQVILSATLKVQEKGKYDNIKYINKIDYSKYPNSHILSSDNVNDFKNILYNLNITLQ